MPQGSSRWRCHDQGTYVEAHADRGPVLHTEWEERDSGTIVGGQLLLGRVAGVRRCA